MNRKGFKNITLVAVVIIVAVAGYFILSKNQSKFPPYSVATDNTFTTNIDGYFETCMDDTTIYKRLNGSWVEVSNAMRKLLGKRPHYLDGKFSRGMWCDFSPCIKFPKPYTLKLVEYQKVGDKAPPPDSGIFDSPLPVYQTVPLSGDVKVDIRYFSDKSCRNKETVSTVIKR